MMVKRGRGRPKGTTQAVLAERKAGHKKQAARRLTFGKGGVPTPDRSKDLSERQRNAVSYMIAHSISQEVIARAVGLSVPTLRKLCPTELANGGSNARAEMGLLLIERAKNPKLPGSTTALIHWLNVHGGPEWQAKYQHRHMHSGPDGGAIPVDVDVSKLTTQQIIALMAEIAGAEAARDHEPLENGAAEAGD